jgi:hypothetical protein
MTSLREELRANTLDLPNPARLNADQVRGGHCCWCNTALTAETAVDLGERRHPTHWFPRCCPTCIRAADHAHVGMCEICVETPGACQTAATLKQLVREHSRTPPPGPRPIAYCNWHRGLSDTALLVRITEEGSGGENGMLYACQNCRTQHGLTPLAEHSR